MKLKAKIFNGIFETSFKQLFNLLLEIRVLFSCAKPGFSHEDDKEMASREGGRKRTPEAERETCQTTE
jgi:hypothetical protein